MDELFIYNIYIILYCLQTGNQMKAKAQGAADSVKNATGMNK